MPDQIHILVSAEKLSEDGNYLLAENDSSYQVTGVALRTDKESKTGDYAVVTGKKSPFALPVTFSNIGSDYYIVATIWRKSNESIAKLVVSSTQTKQLYHMTSDVVATDSKGWEQLKLEFFTPADFKPQEIKVNVWNNGEEIAYFDDLEITILKEKKYPEYQEEAFHIELDTSDYMHLQEIRKRAFNEGVLRSTDDDWINGFVFADGKSMRAKLRLKGDWLDHLHGDKWSFRIKLKDDNTWRRMKVFSLQTPMARLGVNEWYLHKVLLSEDILTTRYGFIPLTFKGKNLGMYAYEDHFTKQLVESQNRREGPILRFVEDALWDTRVYNEEGERNYKKTPVFEAAAIKPFTSSKIMKDSVSRMQYLIAQNLMLQYKERTKSASEIFNIDMLARFFAMSDVFFMRHSLIWHNQRFYYNPVLCKLEPVAFDAYSDIGFGVVSGREIWGDLNSHSQKALGDEFLMLRELFNDTAFVSLYINYLEKYSDGTFIDSVANMFLPQALVHDSLLQIEFPEEVFDTSVLLINARNVRKSLPGFKQKFEKRKQQQLKWINESIDKQVLDTVLGDLFIPNLLHCYLQQSSNDSLHFKVKNFFPEALTILGVGKGTKNMNAFLVPSPDVPSYLEGNSVIDFAIEKTEANYLFFTRKDGDKIMNIEIFQWPEPDGSQTPLQELLERYPFQNNSSLYELRGSKVVFKKGMLTLDHPIIIPQGYTVYMNEGTTLDMINNSAIISYAPVYMMGTKDQPVTITSSDFTSNGFTVLQAGKRSKLDHVIFENLNTLNYKGWTLTGAVNFYESDVDITHTLFYRNQCEDALNTIRSDFTLEEATFENIYGDAFDSDFCTGVVSNSLFRNVGNDAIDFSGSQIRIVNTDITEAGDKGISGGEDSYLTVENTHIARSNIGLASKDLSTVIVSNSTVNDCNYGILLLQKKPEYGPARMILNNTPITNAKTKQLIEKGSEVLLEGKLVKGDRNNLTEIFY